MTRWRGRIGADQLELLRAGTLSVAMRTQAVTEQAMERVTLDTTVQTKAVAHPTCSHLLMLKHRMAQPPCQKTWGRAVPILPASHPELANA
jgi:hypothetical protein